MTPLTYKIVSEEPHFKIQLSGYFDEGASLPDLSAYKSVHIDLTEVTGLNSTGVRTWIQWGETMLTLKEVVLEGCPVIFVKNFTSVKSFLRPNMRVQSFFAPFYSESLGTRKDVLFKSGQDFMPDKIQVPQVTDDSGQPMELDVFEDAYFAFLKK